MITFEQLDMIGVLKAPTTPPVLLLGGWHYHSVDDMDDAIGRFDVRLGHRGIVGHHLVADDVNVDYLAVNGFRFVELDDVGCHHLARHHMIGEDCGELILVLRLLKDI